MLRKIVALNLSLFFVALSVNAQTQATVTQKTPYQSLVERVKKSDPAVDFRELRMAYTVTPDYSPYGGTSDARQMLAALRARDYAKALESATNVLQKNYVDINAHYVGYVANTQLKNEQQAAFHKRVLDGLLKSIEGKADGKSTASAFEVITTDEEYAWLGINGYRTTSQALLNDKGHSYDKMSVINLKTNEKTDFYFNIDKPFNFLGESIKKKQ